MNRIMMVREALPVIEKAYEDAKANYDPNDPVKVATLIGSYRALMVAKRMLGMVK